MDTYSYDEAAMLRIARIKFYQQLGFSIKEIIGDHRCTEYFLRVKVSIEAHVQKLKEKKAEISELIEKGKSSYS